MESFIIEPRNVGNRLDKFLAEKIKGVSRSQIQKKIKSGEITVHKKMVPVHYFLKAGNIIEIEIRNQKSEIMEKNGFKEILTPKSIFEDENFVVLDKPAGLLVHQTEKNEPNTLVHWLKQKYPEIEKVGEHNYRAGIIHRLDREVSGVMLAAKTQKMYHHLKEQFKKRAVAKEYCALVYGHMPEHEGKIELPIGRNKRGKFVAHPRMKKKKLLTNDRHAITLYRVEKKFVNVSLLSIHILTGRTHQIRAHLSALGHPIVGDKKYGPKKPFLRFFSKKIKIIGAPRIMLHSKKIGLRDLNDEWKEFVAPMPREMREFLQQLKTNPSVS